MMSMVLAAMDQQTMRQGMQPFTETLASERRRLGNRSRREGSGSARDETVSVASHRTRAPWALYAWESSAIMRVCISVRNGPAWYVTAHCPGKR